MTSAVRNHPDPEARLRQTSLYRPDLDLVVHDQHDNVAAYGLFWHDPVTATGLVEPMRTENDHQRRGLARHVLTAGVALLADAGAQRIKIVYDPDNPASGHLYRSVGFEPHRHTDLLAGPTTP
jgi:RimJ/RimL family protein N-acetyltransferase